MSVNMAVGKIFIVVNFFCTCGENVGKMWGKLTNEKSLTV